MQLLYKTITADCQVHVGECYLVGALVGHSGTTDCQIYDEPDSTETEARRVIALHSAADNVMLPLPGVKCTGIFVAWNAGKVIVYYYL